MRIPALPISFDGERLPVRRDLPGIGADGGGILREMGIAPAEIERLIASGVVKVETSNNR